LNNFQLQSGFFVTSPAQSNAHIFTVLFTSTPQPIGKLTPGGFIQIFYNLNRFAPKVN
jgi:hypothetical protein